MMQITLLVSLCLLVAIKAVPHGLTVDSTLNDEWETFKTKFGKNYESFTEVARRIIWEQNLRYIQQHNLEYDLGKHTYYLGLNAHADLTNEEFKATFLGVGPIERQKDTRALFMGPENMGALPAAVDWRTKGYVTPVKNQGNTCGSCYAFSATGSLEGQLFRKTGKLLGLSEQQIVDCSTHFWNRGCHGGLMTTSFEYIKQYGIESEAVYPYMYRSGTCKYDKSKVVGTVAGFVDIPQDNETALATAVATVGPVSVAIDAGSRDFHLYKGGIYNDSKCSTYSLNHGVLAVGYGSLGGQNFWIVKNSWGKSWGSSGYILMSKDVDNQCGIATLATYPLV